MEALLILEDGTVFRGKSTSGCGHFAGRVAVNTSIVGYQEAATDPSNAGSIIAFTYPVIGSYGASPKFCESGKCWAGGIVTRFQSPAPSNWQASSTFNDFLRKEGVLSVTGIDTRALAVHIREKGEMRGVLSTVGSDIKKLLADLPADTPEDYIKAVSRVSPEEIKSQNAGLNIGILDLGVLNSTTTQLSRTDNSLTLLPFSTGASEILDMGFDALIISSGPEEGESISKIADTAAALLGKLPMLGISAGTAIICLAAGGRLEKLKHAHRGMNYPVKEKDSFRGEITVQNHAFAVREDSLAGTDISAVMLNVNDGSVEAIQSRSLKIYGVHYYPLGEGPGEASRVFTRFLGMVDGENA